MRVIDVAADLLRDAADAASHAAEQTTIHIEAEIDGRVPELVETLRNKGPYAYTLLSEVGGDGGVSVPVMTTREEIRGAYTMIRGASDLLRVEPLVEVRGLWYTFHEAVSLGRRKGTDTVNANPTLALFPVSTDKGITGELVWLYRPRAALGSGAAPEDAAKGQQRLRRDVLALHERYAEALLHSDVDALLDVLNDGVQSAVRDYVDDTGTVVSLDGKEVHRHYYQALFDRYRIESVGLLHRVVQDWYVFAELRLVAVPRDGRGARVSFHTAEFLVPGCDGRFIACVGHGTDQQP